MAVWSAVSDSGENDVDWVISGLEMMGVAGEFILTLRLGNHKIEYYLQPQWSLEQWSFAVLVA